MASIVWLTCPACTYRFYIVGSDAGKGNEWFCPSCKEEFLEELGKPSDS